MRALQRPVVPTCLEDYRHGENNWDDFSAEDKDLLRQALDQMQHGLCAYCESSLKTWHIEHFRARSTHPQLTFTWDNLFGSCLTPDHCGDYKDKKGKPYDPNELTHPCEQDPDDFLLFVPDGTVQPRQGLSPKHHQCAEETIRVFRLNQKDLCERRAGVIRSMLETEPDILQVLMESTDRDRAAFTQEFLATYAVGPHPTPIRHVIAALSDL